jgi:hypothetical protein
MPINWHPAWAVFNKDTVYMVSVNRTRAKSIRAFVEDAKRGNRIRTDKPWSWWYRSSGLRCRRISVAIKNGRQ